MKRIFYTIIFVFLFLLNVNAQNISEDLKQILILQDSRTLGENNKLLNYLTSPDELIVIQTLNALANIVDSSTVDKIGEMLLNSKSPKIRSEAAFALGQIPCAQSVDFLLKGLESDKDAVSLNSILNALGKTGSEYELQKVLSYSSDDKTIVSNKALSVARFAIRKVRNSESVDFLKSLVNFYQDKSVLKSAAYALWRTADKDLLLPARTEILNLTNSDDPDIRMRAFNALTRLLDISDMDYLLKTLKTETDWRVKINILNALPGYKTLSENFLVKNLLDVFDVLSVDSNPNVRIAELSIIGKLFSNLKDKNSYLNNVKNNLESYFLTENEKDWQEIAEAVNSYGMIFKDDAKGVLLKAFSESDDYDIKPYIIKAFGYFDDALIYREVRDSIISDVKEYATKFSVNTQNLIGSNDLLKIYRAFVEMITMLDKKLDEENLNTTRLIYSEFTGSKDPLLVSMCLNGLKDSIYMKYRDETAAIISFDYNELAYPKDYDVMLLFIDAFGELESESSVSALEKNLKSESFEIASYSAKVLEKITGRTYTFEAKPRYDFDWNALQSCYQNRFAVINTDGGDIKIELFPEIAPFSVMNFYKLATKNYYKGTIFHRVVPNFVIQGGDWSNSGEGGPGYTIRSEFSSVPFETGVVGMASAGRDTEGSQFFIMHSAHYHLDGRYTVFGIVKDGFDVIDNTVYGSTIVKIDFVSN